MLNEEKRFRVWVFNVIEGPTVHRRDPWNGYEDALTFSGVRKCAMDIPGAVSSDMTEAELLDFQAGLEFDTRPANGRRMAVLVRDLQAEQEQSWHDTFIANTIRQGEQLRLNRIKVQLDMEEKAAKWRLEQVAKDEKKRLADEARALTRKRKQLEKLKRELESP